MYLYMHTYIYVCICIYLCVYIEGYLYVNMHTPLCALQAVEELCDMAHLYV